MDPVSHPPSLKVANGFEEPSLPSWADIKDILKRQSNFAKGLLLSLLIHSALLGIAATSTKETRPPNKSMTIRLEPSQTNKIAVKHQVLVKKVSDYSVSVASGITTSLAPIPSKTRAKPASAPSLEKPSQAPSPIFSWWQYQSENMGYFMAHELDELASPINKQGFLQPAVETTPDQAGYVLARIYINERGGVDRVEILEANPPNVFEQALILELYRSSFLPALKDGLAVKSQKDLEIQFEMPSQ